MELLNATRMQAAYTMGTEPSAREHFVVAVKGTFAFPERDGGSARSPTEQAPLVMADEFWGEPGFSSPRYEVDFALRKPRCDVLLNATAYAPQAGRRRRCASASSSAPGPRCSTWSAIGSGSSAPPRWALRARALPHHADHLRASPSAAPTTSTRTAECPTPTCPTRSAAARPSAARPAADPGRPLPNTEAPGDPVTRPWGDYQPMGFGPIGRNWLPRLKLAGTYDQNWIDEVFPFLPADFDDRYYQAAPEDQQIDYPQGGEEVQLLQPHARGPHALPPADGRRAGRVLPQGRRSPSTAGDARHDPDRARPRPRAADLARQRAA